MYFTLITAGWVINGSLLLATVAWVFSDGRAPSTLEEVGSRLSTTGWLPSRLTAARIDQWTAWIGSIAFCISGFLVMLGLVWGRSSWRGLRSWLLAMGLACCWCGLVVLWPDLHWQGQQSRVAKALPQATDLVHRLESSWPQEDGSLENLGLFLAYPKRAPTTLLMMGQTSVPGTSVRFSVVEKTTDGSIRFGLVWPEPNAWLEWRNDGQVPTSFVGGLMTHHEVLRYERLDTHWFLVRYEAGISPHESQL